MAKIPKAPSMDDYIGMVSTKKDTGSQTNTQIKKEPIVMQPTLGDASPEELQKRKSLMDSYMNIASGKTDNSNIISETVNPAKNYIDEIEKEISSNVRTIFELKEDEVESAFNEIFDINVHSPEEEMIDGLNVKSVLKPQYNTPLVGVQVKPEEIETTSDDKIYLKSYMAFDFEDVMTQRYGIVGAKKLDDLFDMQFNLLSDCATENIVNWFYEKSADLGLDYSHENSVNNFEKMIEFFKEFETYLKSMEHSESELENTISKIVTIL